MTTTSSPGPRRASLWAAILVSASIALVAIAAPTSAAALTREPAMVQGNTVAQSAAWTGSEAILFGGGWFPTDTIWQFTPGAESTELVQEFLPSERHQMASVWADGGVYLFGGYGIPSVVYRHKVGWSEESPNNPYLDEILHYDPVEQVVVNTGVHLPYGLRAGAAFWNGTHAFILGGAKGLAGGHVTQATQKILRYDPLADHVDEMGAQLPGARLGAAVVWTGSEAILFGGVNENETFYDQIVRYNPSRDEAELVETRLPTARGGISAVWDGEAAYLFGGMTEDGPTADVLRFDPATDTLETLPVSLPFPLYWASAVWTGEAGYIMGGTNGTVEYGTIFRFDPNDQPPHAEMSFRTSRLELFVDASGSWDPEGAMASYTWKWGDGSPDGQGVNASHTYDEPGTYVVELTVVDAAGTAATVSRSIVVALEEQPPVATLEGLVRDMVLIADGRGSFDPDGELVDHEWDWGDGSAPTRGAVVEHAYEQAGTYLVRLTVTDAAGLETSTTASFVVGGAANTDSAASAPRRGFDVVVRGLTVITDAEGEKWIPRGSDSILWDWGDGSALSRGLRASHTYDAPGAKVIRLTVLRDDGNQTTVERRVTLGSTALIELAGTGVEPATEPPASTFTVSARLVNRGTASGSTAVLVRLGDEILGQTTATLDPGEVRTVELMVQAPSPGDHVITVTLGDDQEGETLTLSSEATDTAPPRSTPTTGPLGVLALLVLYGVARRRRGEAWPRRLMPPMRLHGKRLIRTP